MKEPRLMPQAYIVAALATLIAEAASKSMGDDLLSEFIVAVVIQMAGYFLFRKMLAI